MGLFPSAISPSTRRSRHLVPSGRNCIDPGRPRRCRRDCQIAGPGHSRVADSPEWLMQVPSNGRPFSRVPPTQRPTGDLTVSSVLDHVGQRRLDHLARVVRLLGGPVPERRAESVRHGRDPMLLEHLGQRRRRDRRPAAHGAHERIAVAERTCRVKNLQRPHQGPILVHQPSRSDCFRISRRFSSKAFRPSSVSRVSLDPALTNGVNDTFWSARPICTTNIMSVSSG